MKELLLFWFLSYLKSTYIHMLNSRVRERAQKYNFPAFWGNNEKPTDPPTKLPTNQLTNIWRIHGELTLPIINVSIDLFKYHIGKIKTQLQGNLWRTRSVAFLSARTLKYVFFFLGVMEKLRIYKLVIEYSARRAFCVRENHDWLTH